MTTIVATTVAKNGGRCQHCGRFIHRGEPIFKLDVGRRGPQTPAHNGQGQWVGRCCARPDDDDDA